MRICYGWARKPIVLSSEQRYHPEQLLNRLGPFNNNKSTRKAATPLAWMPVWIQMDGQYIRLDGKEEINLACKLVCVYHNGPGNNAPFCEEEDWHNISEKEAFLAEVGAGEAESEEDNDTTD